MTITHLENINKDRNYLKKNQYSGVDKYNNGN